MLKSVYRPLASVDDREGICAPGGISICEVQEDNGAFLKMGLCITARV